MTDEVKKLYTALLSKGYSTEDLGDESTFRSKMSDKSNRRDLYDWVSSKGNFRLGDYDTYESRLTSTPTNTPSAQLSTQQVDIIRRTEDALEKDTAPVFTEQQLNEGITSFESLPDLNAPLTGFWEGVAQGSDALVQGNKYGLGETLDLFQKDAQEYKDAIALLDSKGADFDASKFDADTEIEEAAKARFDKRVAQYRATMEQRKKARENMGVWDKLVHIANDPSAPNWNEVNHGEGINEVINYNRPINLLAEALKESGGDVNKARAILEEKSNMGETYAQELMRESSEKLANMRPVEGRAWWGQMIPQMTGQAAALGLRAIPHPVAQGASTLLGLGSTAALTGSAMGSTMHEARQSGATNGVWKSGLLSGAIELGTEAIPFGRLFDRVGASAVREGVRNAVTEASKTELDNLLKLAQDKIGGKFLSYKTGKAMLKDMGVEGLSEAVAGLGESFIPMAYGGELPTFEKTFTNMGEGFLAGVAMGGFLGGGSHAITHYGHQKRREAQGGVAIGEYTNDNGGKEWVEVTYSKGGKSTIMHQDGTTEEVSTDKLDKGHFFTMDEWKKGIVDANRVRLESAYASGKSATDPAELQSIGDTYSGEYNYFVHKYGKSKTDEVINNAFGAISTLEGNEKEDAIRLAEAYNSYRGVSERFRADMQQAKAEAEATIDSHISQEDGMIHKATLKDGRDVYVVGGNVVQSEDGSVDLTASTGSVAVTDAKTGDIDMISPDDFVSLEQAIDPKEERERVLQESIAMHQELMHDALFGGVAVGETHTVLDTEGNPIQVQVVTDNGDGTVNVTTDGQMVIPMSKDDVLLHERSMRMADYQMQRGLDMTGQSADPVFYLGDGITFTDADGNTISGTVASSSDDGVQIQTPSGVLQRPREMLNDAITNVTDEDGNVRWDRANPVGATSENEGSNDVASNSTEGSNTTPQAELSEVKKRMPKNDKGELLYEQAEADDAWDAILEDTDNDVEMARRVANDMVAQKEAELKAIEKKKTKSATTIPEKIAIEKARKAEIAKAKQDLEAWKNIAGTTKRREEAAKAEERRRAEEAAAQRKAEEERLKAEREEALRQEREALNGVPDMVDDTPQDARARGYRRVGGHKVERQSPVRGVAGKDVQVKFSNKAMPQGRVMVIEANELQPSHTQGQRNAQHFLDEAQPKERKDSASMLASQKIAENIRPEEITSSVTAYTGAPTTNSRGEVIQGNSRSDALKQMWDSYPEQAAKYKQYLIDHAEELGLDAETVSQMERPVLVNMLEVADEDAITLGQFVAQDTESGGVERIKAKNVLQKMGSDVRNFANRLLQSADEDTSFAGLIDANGASVIQWMAQKGYITPTQQQSAYDGKGNLTAEAKNDLRSIMYQSIFKGGNTQLEEMFNALPVKAQKAILATAYRDFESPVAERMIEEIQSSISAFYALSQDSAFASARNITEARAAIEAWKNQYQMDDVTGESYLPSDKFSNFALHLATMYKGENQSVIQGTFNKMFDLIQGIKEADLFNENPDTTPRTLVEAIKEVLNIDYNGQLRSNVLGDNHPASQRGQQGSTGNVASGEQNQDGQGTDDGGRRTGISDIERKGLRDATDTTGRRKGYSDKKRTVVKTEPQQPNNAVSTDSSLSESGVSGITPTEPNGESTVPFDDSKVTDNSSAEQKNAGENVSGGVNELIAQAESETDVTPTEGQKKAGNYKKGKVKVAGYEISIEQPKGSVRRGVDANGKAWEQTMHNTYGYFLGTEGVDGDHIDVFLANDMDAWNGEQVFVVDQYNEDGSFDEHKVMLGFNSIEDAQSAYLSNYEDGWADKHNIVVTGTSASDFKKWVDSSHRKTKAFAEYKTVKTTEGQSMGEPTHETETLENGDVRITNRNSRGEVTNVSVERDGKIVSVDSYQDGALFERTEYDADGNATKVTRYGKNGEVVGVQEYEGGVVKTGKRSDIAATKETKGKKVANEEAKIEDVGEVLAGARKDALKVIASAFENATVQSLIELPFAKAFKKPDLKKAVESGALREEDAAFYEAWFSTMINTAKPKLSRRVRESHIRSWAEDVYKTLQVLKEFVEADVATRDRIVAEMMANKFPTEAEELAKIEQRKEWNKGSNTTWGDKTTPNRLWVAHEVLKRLGYKAGDKIDIPYGILQANATGTGYDFYNSKGQRLVMNAVATVEEGIEHIVYLTKLKRGDADVKHPVSSFTFVPTKTDYVESGRYRVVYGSVYNPSIREFDSLYEAETFARNRKDAFVRPISEVSRQYAYKVKFVHPLTGEKMFADEKEFDTRSEVEQYLQDNYDAVNEHVNDELAKERGEKRALSADDVVEVVAFYGEGKIQYSVCVHRKYANNMGMPLPLRDFATRAEAVKYASEIKDDIFKAIQQSIEDRKAFTFFATGEDTRIGEDYRQGKDVTADEFMEAFGFRGVQFGNWTNQRDRQMAVNQAYDALHDLAKLLGVSPKALSLNGELGIAFGSRGSGNANAHYELDEVVINLTKTRGAGSLAHEWWHALDNYFARMAEVPRGMVTDSRNLPMREALREAFNALLSQVDKSKYLQRSKSRGDYWGRMHEVTARLLAEWVDQSLKAKGEVNTFLSRGADVEKYKQMNYKLYKRATEVAGETPMPYEEFAELDAALDGIPYPTAEEVSEFGAALRRIFDVMQERETDDGKVALFNIADEALMAERGSEAFERATERTIDALKAAGVEVVEATDEMAEEVLKLLQVDKGNAPDFHRVYHGTGAKFDKFDHSNMGSGEGHQAFGWGTYVTESEEIGRYYASATSQVSPSVVQHAEKWLAENPNYEEFLATGEGKMRLSQIENVKLFINDMRERGVDEKNIEYWQEVVNSQEQENSREKYEETRAYYDRLTKRSNTPILYTVEITDDNGANYLNWERGERNDGAVERIAEGLQKEGFELNPNGNHTTLERDGKRVVLNAHASGADLYAELSDALGSDKAASEFLNSIGYVGIKYPTESLSGGNKDGKSNYVIFNEADAQITDRVEFLRTADGTVYGWTVGGKVYLTKEGMNPNTPAHEYTHLWAQMVEQTDPQLWGRIVDGLRGSATWNEVLRDEAYKNIWGDENRMASEVLSRLTGAENYRREMARAQAEIDATHGVFDKAEKVSAWENVKMALRSFLDKVKRLFGFNAEQTDADVFATADSEDVPAWMEFVDMALGDLYGGVNPGVRGGEAELMFIGERGAAAMDKAEEATTRLDNLAVARDMESAEKDALAIKMATGWERGADGKWRYETEDVKLKKDFWKKKDVTLGDVADLGELGKAYPDLKDIKVVFDTNESERRGTYSHKNNTITLFIMDANNTRKMAGAISRNIPFTKFIADYMTSSAKESVDKTLVHEIQHAIQSREGFAKGGNKRMRIGESEERLGYEGYRKLAGEVEARNVSERMGKTMDERRASLRTETQDVADKDQIFIYDALESAMGSRVDKRMADIAQHFADAELSERQRAIVDVFGGVRNNLPITIERSEGSTRRVVMRQGREDRGGTKHALLRHYGTSSGNYTADELLLIEDVLANGKLTEKQRRGVTVNEYQHEIDGVRYTVVTEKKDNREEFTDFYTNRSGDTRSLNTQLSARAGHTTASSEREVTPNSVTEQDNGQENDGATLFSYKPVGGNRGYVGYSMSKRAAQAREEGRFPKTDFKKEYGVTEKVLDGLVKAGIVDNSEWHHTSMYGNKTPFYGWVNDAYADVYAENKKAVKQIIEGKDADGNVFAELPTKNPYTEMREKIPEGWYPFLNNLDDNLTEAERESALMERFGDAYAKLKEASENNRLYYEYEANKGRMEREYYAKVGEKLKEFFEDKVATASQLTGTDGAATMSQRSGQGDIVTREGEGSYSDDALSGMSDPMAKMLGASTYSARQRREFAERARKRMVRRAESIAKELHLDNVEVVTDVSVLPEGKKRGAKGFYSKSTGKITIVVPNHAGTYDIQQTVLHEAVAHYGLRQLFGTHFDTFLDNVFENVSSEIRNRIIGLARQNGWDFRTATEEYLATLAEDVEFSAAQKSSWWSKIKGFFLKMLADAGVKLDFTLSDNELRYILWRSYQNLANPGKYASVVEQAADIAKQSDLKVGNYRDSATDLDAVAEQVRESEDALFREDTPRERAIIRDRYERRVKTGWYQTQEALQDSMLGLKEAMEAIVGDKTYIEDIEGFENAYLGENRLSSVNKAEIDWFVNTHFKPLYEIVKGFASTEEEQEVLEDYMFAKHGLERNRVMAEREAQKAYDAYKAEHPRGSKTLSEFVDEYRKQDYAGLTALTGKEDVAEAEAEAQSMVAIYETEHSNTDLLWMKWNQVTKAILEKTYKSGIISKQTFDKISGMYEYYVPLRGFDETTSMDEYAYLGKKDNGFNPPVKVAGGRRSKADNPFAYLESMAESSIMQGNRNELVKQKMLNFVLNHPSDLFSVSELWLEHDDVTDEWKPVFPTTLSEYDSPEEIQQKMDDFEARMEALAEAAPDKYKRGRDAKDIPYRVVDKATLSEHQVIVKRNGRSVIITVNGNPRAAQALNGMTNPDNHAKGAIDKILRTGEKVNRWLSANYTTRNPDFVAGNFLRDTLYTNIMAWVKESPNYALIFHKNWALCNPVMMGVLYKKYQNGTLDMSNELEAMFKQFMLNGGETGYMNMSDVETHKKEIAKKLRTKNAFKNGWEVLKDFFDYINRSVENTARFAAFVTSRQMGRSIDRSIYDAKEISVNFNKKGAGDKFLDETGQTRLGNASAGVSAVGRSGFVFWNAALQGSTNFGRQVKRHPVKALSAAASMFMLGALMAYWWGDDDDDDYYNLPDYVRRSNIIFPAGGSSYVSLPLPIEFRAMYGMGELMMSVMKGKERKSGWELGMEIASQASQVFPIDVLEGGGSWTNFVPSAVKPIVDVARNVGWTGLPIYKDNPYNENNPEYTEVYSSANKQLVGIFEWLNNNTGGDAHTKGAINFNPAGVEYLLESYFGGYASTANKMIKMGETWFGNREYDPRSFLLWNRLVKSGYERTEQRYVNDTYFKLIKEADVVEHRLRGYKNDTKYGIFDYAEKISFLEQSPEYGRYEILKPYQRKIEKYQRKIKEAEKKNRTDRVDEWKEKIDSLKHLIVEEVEAYDKMRKQ